MRHYWYLGVIITFQISIGNPTSKSQNPSQLIPSSDKYTNQVAQPATQLIINLPAQHVDIQNQLHTNMAQKTDQQATQENSTDSTNSTSIDDHHFDQQETEINAQQNMKNEQEVEAAQIMSNEQTVESNESINEKESSWLGNVAEFFSENKWGIFGTGALGGYVLLWYHILRQQRFLESPCRWCNWHINSWNKKNFTYKSEQFNEWLRNLASQIHVQHMNRKNPFDRVGPTLQFIKEIDCEHKQLYTYLFLTSVLKRMWLTALFPFSAKTRKDALKRLRHLNRVYRLFLVTLNHKNLYADDYYFMENSSS